MKQKLKEIHNKALTTLSEIKQMKELEEAKVKLEKIIDEAIKELEIYKDNGRFLRELALYIENRNK